MWSTVDNYNSVCKDNTADVVFNEERICGLQLVTSNYSNM
jgi:hypothetical protein